MDKKDLVVIIALSIFALFLWSQPISESPFGEVDASAHFSLGDYMAEEDEPISKLPFYINKRYGTDNQLMQGYLWYPPQFHVSIAMMQIFGGTRISSVFMFMALLSLLMVPCTYIIIRKLYGFMPATLSSLLLIFSGRDITMFLFGLWPLMIAYAITLILLYSFYKYSSSYLKGEEKKIYLYITGLLMATVFFIHPQGWAHSMAALFFFILFIGVKEKRVPFNVKTGTLVLVIFVLFLSIIPIQSGNFFYQLFFEKTVGDYVGTEAQPGLSSLFSWFHKPEYSTGFPDSYLEFSSNHGGYWLIPFILIGAVFLIMKRRRKDVMLLSWMFALYILMHLDIIGTGRTYKSLADEAHILYPVAALGMVFVINLIASSKIIPAAKRYIKYAGLGIFIFLIFMLNFSSANSQLENGYAGISRVTEYQIEASEWIKGNIPEDAELYAYGTMSQQKSRWMRMLSHRWIGYGLGAPHGQKWTGGTGPYNETTHILIDYSDMKLLKAEEQIKFLEKVEQSYENRSELLYDENMIKVYKLEDK